MRLLACISHHGRGHLAQSAPVLDALCALRPDIELTVLSGLATEVLAGRIHSPFRHIHEPADCGVLMRDALRPDLEGSLSAYLRFHGDWEERLSREAQRLRTLGFDRVFSNVAYLPLAAANRAGLPCAALCSLNWLDIFHHYLGDRPGAGRIEEQMRAAYLSASLFLRPEPSMPMSWMSHTLSLPPIAQRGRQRRAELRQRLAVPAHSRLVLLGMGGIDYRLSGKALSGRDEWIWLVPEGQGGRSDCVRTYADTGMPFLDLLASCDALITKPGYGAFVEAAAMSVPVLYLPRPDWPETPWLMQWLHAHARAMQIDEAQLQSGEIQEALGRLWALPQPQGLAIDGAQEAARRLLDFFA